ncbi:DUF115 domain-containing protein [Eubacterium sp. MSJ-13]|uniref:motility associated factor glycosyltransferase family protein n=1 Tax=Eubacterium sp. MSJ-13 TaxID=2841513 RepID=UPI001C0FDBBC|nr:6-hydroxymethylpterin diphosphokinase MptE-like protein [Eubacterium sp. MSJ-13]MBU5477772.1 DUF115 domain-containing protein [Eubacterium sp. MSJ-13]
MNFWDKNVECLKENRVDIYEKVKEIYDEKKYDFEKFTLVDTREGLKTIEIDSDGKKIRLNSLYSPTKEAERWTKQFDFNNIGVSLVMFGIANGVFADAAIRKLKSDTVIFLVEPDVSLFIYCLQNFDLCDIIADERVLLYIDMINYTDFYFSMLSRVHWSMIPTQLVACYPGLDKIYPEKAKEFADTIEKLYIVEGSENYTAAYLSKICTLNTINNFHFIKNSNYIMELVHMLPKDVPVIIVAAGPSLDKNIDELKRAKGKAFILATDTAVKYLIAHDVWYDAIITLDARKDIGHLSDERSFEHPMFAILDARNEILEMNQGKKIWFSGSGFLSKLYQGYGLIFPEYGSGGSVATAAFNVAKQMGAERIVLIGQDLAFAGDSTHAGGTKNHADDECNGIIYVEDIYGNQIKSRGDWKIYIDWFSAAIEEVKGSIEVIDATEGGAKLKGSKIMELSEVIDKYCGTDFDFGKELAVIPPTFDDEKYKLLREDLFHLQKELKNIEIYARDGIQAAKDMIEIVRSKKPSPKKENKCLKTVKKANNFIAKQMVYSILDDYIAGELNEKLKDINCLTEDEDENIIKTYEMAEYSFEAIINGVKALTPILDESLKKI